MPVRRFLIRGIVQGVGFRYAMCQEAERLGVNGWVRNRRDGSVEAVALAEPGALDALQQWAARGPRGARVDAVETTELTDDPATIGVAEGFTQAPTA
jgi:acylphosphatase